jgi:type II secretory pathway pseudopilin PulG
MFHTPCSMNKSFTIIETLVTVLVFGLMMGVISGLIIMAYKSHGYSIQQSIAINEARKGIKTMVKEIREAKPGDDGSYPIEKAEDKEFIFYSDIDKDGATEKVRYFLGSVSSGSQTQECVSFQDGGFCNVNFSNFLSGGTLESAQVTVSVEGDFGQGSEYAEIFTDGSFKLGNICQSGCSDCAGDWQGTTVFNVTAQATDDDIGFAADARSSVDDICDWIDEDHSMKVRFELSWTESITGADHEFKKGITNPTGIPPQYPQDQEAVTIITSYVRNNPPIFTYFNGNNQEITERPARLQDTKVMELYLVINVNPKRAPQDFELTSSVQLRNLKSE